MAEGKTKEFAGGIGEVFSSAESRERGDGGNDSTGTTGTEKTGRKGKTAEAKQGVPGLAVVEVPTGEKPEKKKSGQKKKQPTTKAQKKAAEVKELAGNLTMLIKTGFDMTAIRLGTIWEVTETECEKIAEPLARILDRYGVLEKAAEYSDMAALVSATVGVVIPRYLVYTELKKEGKQLAKPKPARENKPAAERSDGENGVIPGPVSSVKKSVPGLSL